MTILIIPIAPLSRTKSRLRKYFSNDQLVELTIAMFKDLGKTLSNVSCYNQKVVYCNALEILDLAENYNLIGVKEKVTSPPKSFDQVISDLNKIAINQFNSEKTVISFLDLILITAENFYDIHNLIQENQLVICPAIQSAGISILGRNPSDVISTFFSDPNTPSLFALLKNAAQLNIKKIAIYDSFRASFDIDVIQDLILAFEYLKIFKLTHTEVFKFLNNNLKYSIKKKIARNNRTFKIVKRE